MNRHGPQTEKYCSSHIYLPQSGQLHVPTTWYSRGKRPRIISKGGWMGPRDSLDALAKSKNIAPAVNRSLVVHPFPYSLYWVSWPAETAFEKHSLISPALSTFARPLLKHAYAVYVFSYFLFLRKQSRLMRSSRCLWLCPNHMTDFHEHCSERYAVEDLIHVVLFICYIQ
jgi:hypothetical protein